MSFEAVMIVAGLLALVVFAIGFSAAKRASQKAENTTPAQ